MSTRRKRLAILCGFGVVLILAAVGHLYFHYARPIGSGPAGPNVDRTAFAKPWTERKVKLVGIGDSVTAGFGADTPEHSYFNRLIRNPADEFADMQGLCLSAVIPNLEFENLAVSGSTSRDHHNTIDNRLATHDADVFGLIVITTGGNDIIHNYGRTPPKECAMYGATVIQAEPWIEAFRTRLDEMLDKIDAAFPGGCEIYLGDIYDPTDGVGDAPSVFLPHWPDGLAIHAKYNAIIRAAVDARPNVHLVPMHATFLGHGAHCLQFWRRTYDSRDPHYWYFDNIEDPNTRGYDALRRIFLNEIAKHSKLRGDLK
jgi:lysophospholipase L1-like esterase